MKNKFSDIKSMQLELRSAIDILESSVHVDPLEHNGALSISDALKINETVNFLERCLEVVNTEKEKKPVLRVIHHLACSGGSLITKCISALPNVFVLSEVHPHSYRHLPKDEATFLPSDIATLAYQAGFPESKKLAVELFRNSVIETAYHVESYGGTLVLRDHSHSDYCVGDEYQNKSTVLATLKDDFDIRSLVTLRNPIDCYASLKSNYWLHFSPETFDEYCLRVLKFLEPFESFQILEYESFVEDPKSTMRRMCDILDLTYDESFVDTFDYFLVTGDSGRKGTVIEPRSRRKIDEEFRAEIAASKNFSTLCEIYHFSSQI
ncbi:hypothetical protein [Alteromonas sp. A079]|uniref:hypothetical protein n=1 Tax=Alteromonas sp. A079 TaxID=3410268 RepID=UPI003B9FAF20